MFQTGPIIFLQSFKNDLLTLFMRIISTLGHESFFVVLCIIILFGISFRKGFILTQIILLMPIINNILKQIFALPRPLHVDTNVLSFYGNYAEFDFTGKGAKTFFGLLDKKVISFMRNYAKSHDFSFGFPSGHMMSSTGLWVSLSLLFKKRIIIIFTPIMIILMALSRMYLGRHFLADVIGGTIFALIIIFILYYIYIKFNLGENLFKKENYLLKTKNFVLLFYLLIIPLIFLFMLPALAGILSAINLSFLIILIRGLPDDQGSVINRILRVNIAFISYVLIYFSIKGLIKLSSINDDIAIMEFIKNFIPVFSSTILTYFICLKTKLYKLENEN